MEDYEKQIENARRASPFQGGVITVRPRASLASGQFSVLNNARKWYPGLEKRRGMDKFHSVEIEEPGTPTPITITSCGEHRVVIFGSSLANARAGISDQLAASVLVNFGTSTEVLSDYSGFSGGTWTITRCFFHFDLSPIPPASVFTSATFRNYSPSTGLKNQYQVYGGNINFICAAPAGVEADFLAFDATPISGVEGGFIPIVGQLESVPLNATGLTYLQGKAGGVANMFCREYDHDVLNVDQSPDTTNYDAEFTGLGWGVPAERPALDMVYLA